MRFEDVTTLSGISYEHAYAYPTPASEPEEFGGGVASGDFDGDGLVDLFVLRGDIGPNLLYRNVGGNAFEEVAEAAGVAYTKSQFENYRHSGPAFADVDGDGDLDLFVGGIEYDPSFLFRNEGDGTFTDVSPGSGIDTVAARYTLSAAFGDYDLDGDLDMFLTHWGTPRGIGDQVDTEHLWRNDTVGGVIRFTDVSLLAGIAPDIIEPEPVESFGGAGFDYTFSPTFARIDGDRFPDLLITGDFRTSMVYLNNTDGTFRNATDRDVIVDRNGMGSAVGDYDGDGDLDWFVTSIWSRPDENGDQRFKLGNRLYNNEGGVFADVTDAAGVHDGGWGWAACFADFDNDTDLDIYHTNGWIEPFAPDRCSWPPVMEPSPRRRMRRECRIGNGVMPPSAPTSTTMATWTFSKHIGTRGMPRRCGATTVRPTTTLRCVLSARRPTRKRRAHGSGRRSAIRNCCARSSSAATTPRRTPPCSYSAWERRRASTSWWSSGRTDRPLLEPM
ncbi:MAG: VCBS repeat-containing protein [Pseudomonadales bacterium]|nr:VCBS repeat-containing protein [Pseudomonadales bacterium]